MLRRSLVALLLMLAAPNAMAGPFDDLFVRYEAQGSLYELAFARLGVVRATRPDLRAYAATLINDHEAYGAALRDLAVSEGIAVPSGLAASDQARLDRLAHTRPAGFDRAFLREARRINSKDMRALRRQAAREVNPQLRGFVDRSLAMDARHDAAARALSEHLVAGKAPVLHPPRTGDAMALTPPPSASSMAVIAPPPAPAE